MNGITAWMEKYLVPVAAKIGSQKHLVALRDSFIGMLPATLAGALAAMISAIVTTFPSAIQQMMLGATAFSKLAPEKVWTLANTPIIGDLNNISALVNQGTLTVIVLSLPFLGVTIWPVLTESMTSLVVSYQLQPYLQVCQTKWVNLQQPLVQVKLV